MAQPTYEIPPVCTRTHPRRGDTVGGSRGTAGADLGTSEQVAGYQSRIQPVGLST